MKKLTTFNIGLLISNIFFLLLYITLSLNNRLAVDDFHFLSNVEQFGVINGAIYEYSSWSTRWSSVLLNHTILSIYKSTKSALFLFGIISLLLMAWPVFLLLSNTKSKHLQNLWLRLNLAIYIVSVIFFTTIKIDETWFWLCASCTYLWSIIMFFWGTTWLLSTQRSIPLAIIASLAFSYLGGSCGPLALITMLLLIIFFLLTYFVNLQLSIPKKTLRNRLILGFSFCLVAFIILYMGPGNKIRESFFEKISFFESLVLNIKMSGIIILYRLPMILPFAIIMSLPIIYLGHINYSKNINRYWKMEIFWITVCYFLIIYLYQLPITYKTQDVGAYRALFPISILTIIFVGIILYLIGKNVSIEKKTLKFTLFTPVIISIFFIGITCFQQIDIVLKYSDAYDQRIEYLKLNRNKNKLLILDPLPSSGMIFSAEISKDPLANMHFKKGLNLKGNVKLKDK